MVLKNQEAKQTGFYKLLDRFRTQVLAGDKMFGEARS